LSKEIEDKITSEYFLRRHLFCLCISIFLICKGGEWFLDLKSLRQKCHFERSPAPSSVPSDPEQRQTISTQQRDCHACVLKLLPAGGIGGALRRAGTPSGLAMTISKGIEIDVSESGLEKS
jgi:hypothetical protein